jgi:sortase (surface protein transpeptidase)
MLSRSVVLVAVLAITTGWSAPAQAPVRWSGDATAAAAPRRDVTGSMVRATAWEYAWNVRATSARLAAGARHAPEVFTVAQRPRDAAPEPARPKVEPRTAPHVEQKAESKPRATANETSKASAPTYRGRNHFWIPSLGMSYGVRWYGCKDSFYPGNYIYRWGCAGKNNVYILGHAHSVMKPLHDLYVSGRLRVGLVAVYADANGRVRKYRVTEWRVVRPTEIAWQIAPQRVPSMTLQTCVGKNSEYRLNVRLVAFN